MSSNAGTSVRRVTPAACARWFLLASGLVVAGFYFALYRQDNAAPAFDTGGYGEAGPGLAWGTDRCWSNGRKLAARGWIARKGHGTSRRMVQVVLVGTDGRARVLATSLQQRDDVSALLNRQFGDKVVYRHAGFAASLNLESAHVSGDGRLFVAYDDGDMRAMVPLSCVVQGTSR